MKRRLDGAFANLLAYAKKNWSYTANAAPCSSLAGLSSSSASTG